VVVVVVSYGDPCQSRLRLKCKKTSLRYAISRANSNEYGRNEEEDSVGMGEGGVLF
jgi:hypothetical protein